jgi:hypothetical protein
MSGRFVAVRLSHGGGGTPGYSAGEARGGGYVSIRLLVEVRGYGASWTRMLPLSGKLVTAVVVNFVQSLSGLRSLSRSRNPVRLILFSDWAEEALPPGTPGLRLAPFARIFSRPGHATGNENGSPPPAEEANPWYPSFSGGRRISEGVAAAREAIQRDTADARVLLISDLGDAPDDRSAAVGAA